MEGLTLRDVLLERKRSETTGIGFIEGHDQETFLSYSELYCSALKVLGALQFRGIAAGNELIIQIQDNQAFVIIYWACILGGIIPVPLSVGQNDNHRGKIFTIWGILKNPYLITAEDNFSRLEAFAQAKLWQNTFSGIADKFINEREIWLSASEGRIYSTKPDDIAFIQFSSGSTGSPKGVVLTHKNIITNIGAIAQAAGYTKSDSTISWMPLTHDMGLIGFHLSPLFSGINQFLISTAAFIRRPALWLDKVSEHSVSILSSPNFGYKYLLRHLEPDSGKSWDLSCVRILYNGAEPIYEQLCNEFLTRMAAYGLPRKSMCPVYGLAEASLAVSISGLDDEVMSIRVVREKLNVGDKVLVSEEGKSGISVVNVGMVVADCLVRIVNNAGRPVQAGVIGHIQIKGSNVTSGYYNNRTKTRELFAKGGWLRTGDLGFLKEGCLYITGRAKDVFFVNGQNFYPHDLEQLSLEIEGIELNKIAIAGRSGDDLEADEVIAFVYHRGKLADFVPLMLSLKEHINSRAGIVINRILPVNDIPRTTSGKLQRFKLLEQLKNGDFSEVEAQLRRLAQEAEQLAVRCGPAGANEQVLLKVWQRILGIEDIGMDQRFFEIGGNSLKAAEVVMMLAREFQAELPLERIFERQTIRELAPEIRFVENGGYMPIPAGPTHEYYPLSRAQKRLFYFGALNPSSTAYNVPVAMRIKGNIDISRLEAGMNELICRHDTLRMSFLTKDGAVFRIADDIKLGLECMGCEEEGLNTLLENMVWPFDLSTAPLFRVKLIEIKEKEGEYVLFFDFHHLIADGISVHHFIRELFEVYSGMKLPVSPVEYKDVVYWEQSRDISRQRSYWISRLQGELPVLELPMDFPRPAITSTEGAKRQFVLPEVTTARLREVATANKSTLHVLLFSLFNLLLSKLTGQKDIIVGIPVAGRTHPDLAKMIGMFVNNLAIRSSINGDETFAQLLAVQRNTISSALGHQEYPFEQLVREIGVAPDSSRNPLFDAMFIYQSMGLPDIGNAGLTASPCFFDPGISKFDISMEVFEQQETILWNIEYSTRLFKKENIERFAGYFENLIGYVISNNGEKIANWSLMGERERFRLITSVNTTEKSYPGKETIHGLFREQVFRGPSQIAIEYRGKEMSYRELYDKAASLAVMLRAQGLVPNTIVAIALHRSPQLIVSILAVLMAGGCYLPIEPGLPDERIRLLVGQSQCKFMISEDKYMGRLRFWEVGEVGVLNMDEIDWSIPRPGLVEELVGPDDPAYVIYTSGTTGQPKGVLIRQRSLVNYIQWAAATYIKGEAAAFPVYTSIAFDLTVTSIFTPLITGNKCVVYDEEGDVSIVEVINENKCDIVKLTPSHLKIVAACRIPIRSRVRRFIVGGEQLETALAKRIFDLYSGQVEIYNEYGPTEATVGCMIYAFSPGDRERNVPIGLPIANTQVYVLDEYLTPAATGVRGELYVGGDGLAMGYLYMEDLTREKFIPDPFREGGRLYRTGDIARWLPDGVMEYMGRMDEQVKINGYRIELSEVEHCLNGHSGIAEALVMVREQVKGRKSLCAYVVIRDGFGGGDPGTELRNYMAGKLPHYMIPESFVAIEEIPLTKNGKIDASALPSPLPANEKETVYPRTEKEAIISAVWEQVLEKPAVSVTESFFAMGGDSIKAVQIASRLAEKGLAVNAKDVLVYHTVEQLAINADMAHPLMEPEAGPVRGVRGLLPIERWFFSRRFVNPNYFNQSVLFKLRKEVDKGMLEKAFEALIAHHDGLRLNYDPAKNVMFYNASHLGCPFVIKYYETGANGEQDELTDICRSLKGTFRIESSLLLKAAIIRDVQAGLMLFVTAHHLVVDGVSWRILMEDLYKLYAGLERGIDMPLPRKTTSSAIWGKKWEEYAFRNNSDENWFRWNELQSLRFSIPLESETDDWDVRHRREVSRQLSRNETTTLLEQAYKAYKSDVRLLLSTAFALALKGWTQQSVLVIEYEGHGRHTDLADISRTAGWFTEMYPVRLEPGDGNIGSQLRVLKDQLRNESDRGLGYGIYKYSGLVQERDADTMTEVRFNYLGQFSTELNNDLLRYSLHPTGEDTDPDNKMTARLELIAMIVDHQLRVQLYYNYKAHAKQTITRLIDDLFYNMYLIINHIMDDKDSLLTPSDFDAANLDDEELNVLFK